MFCQVNSLRVIYSRPDDAFANMAVDEALLNSFLLDDEKIPILRLYSFSRPSVTAGYFQGLSAEDYAGRDKVRRITGGGIVLHGRDLTIAFVFSLGRMGVKGNNDVYRWFSLALREGLCHHIPQVGIKDDREPVPDGEYECFQRPVEYDLLWYGRKLAGCAGRRRKGAFLLHSSLRVFSGEKDGAGSLEEILEREMDIEEVADWVSSGICNHLGFNPIKSEIKMDEMALAVHLQEKYSSPQWNFK